MPTKLASLQDLTYATALLIISGGLHGSYVSVTAFSVMGAHILFVVHPQSAFAEQLVAPVARGLEFLDAHWKSVLILVAPFIAPVARDLVPRVRKIWGVEFDPVQLELEGVHDKPVPEGESKVS